MVVVFKLLAHGVDDDIFGTLYFEQRDAAERPKGMISSRRKGLCPALRQVKGDDFSVANPAQISFSAVSARFRSPPRQ